MTSCHIFLRSVPPQRQILGSAIPLQEGTVAVQHLSTGRAAGICGECSKLLGWFGLVKEWCVRLWDNLSWNRCTVGPKYSVAREDHIVI